MLHKGDGKTKNKKQLGENYKVFGLGWDHDDDDDANDDAINNNNDGCEYSSYCCMY